jgi:8-oxo-dGTP diphosphatase
MKIKVTCAIIIHGNKVMAAKRSSTMPHPGYWEFPGGKVKDGELYEAGLKREITEELQCEVAVHKQIKTFNYCYPDKEIELIPFICTLKDQMPIPVEHDEICWVTKDELRKLNLLPADIPIANYIVKNFTDFTFNF